MPAVAVATIPNYAQRGQVVNLICKRKLMAYQRHVHITFSCLNICVSSDWLPYVQSSSAGAGEVLP